MLIYGYDAANRLAGITDWFGKSAGYAYDAANNLVGVSYPNNAALAFAYDSANRLLRVNNTYRGSSAPNNPISSFTYALDPVGNRLKITDGTGVTTAYAYDALNELASVKKGNLATNLSYDPVGNRLSVKIGLLNIAYSYDADDRLNTASAGPPIATVAYKYDANGNQIGRTLGGLITNTYGYDAANRLITASNGLFTDKFGYDGDGNRVTQDAYSYVNDVATGLPVVLQEQGPDSQISDAHGLGLIEESSAKFKYFYQYDALGSVIGLTDVNGNLAAQYAYDAWGNTDLLRTQDLFVGTRNKFRFTGEALDPGTGLYYLRARYYDATTGRFLSRDPLRGSPRTPLTRNRYLYALSDPIRFGDPSGLAPQDTAGASRWTPTALDFLLPNTILNPQAAAQGVDPAFCTGQSDCVSYFLSGFGLIFNFQGPVGIGLSLTEFGVEFNRDNAEPNAWSKWASIIIDAGGLAVGLCSHANITYCKAGEIALRSSLQIQSLGFPQLRINYRSPRPVLLCRSLHHTDTMTTEVAKSWVIFCLSRIQAATASCSYKVASKRWYSPLLSEHPKSRSLRITESL